MQKQPTHDVFDKPGWYWIELERLIRYTADKFRNLVSSHRSELNHARRGASYSGVVAVDAWTESPLSLKYWRSRRQNAGRRPGGRNHTVPCGVSATVPECCLYLCYLVSPVSVVLFVVQRPHRLRLFSHSSVSALERSHRNRLWAALEYRQSASNHGVAFLGRTFIAGQCLSSRPVSMSRYAGPSRRQAGLRARSDPHTVQTPQASRDSKDATLCRWPTALSAVKPRPHQQQCRSNVRLCRITVDFVATNGNNVRTFIVNFRPFHKVETNWTCSICFDFVERTQLRSTLLPKPATLLPKTATMSKHHSTCRQNRSTCSIRQCCLDIVAGVDGA